jgi:hypothetical protein
MRHLAVRIGVAVVTFLVGVTSAGLVAGVWPGASPLSGEARAVLAVEREYVRAHMERDLEALDRVLADDFTSFGGRVRKEHRMAMLANPVFKITSLVTEGVRVEAGRDEARVTGRARLSGSVRGREFTTPQYEFTRRYERRAGRWQIVSCEFSYGW